MFSSFLRLAAVMIMLTLFQSFYVEGKLLGRTCSSPTAEFLLFDDVRDFNSAINLCSNEGGTLARISSIEEYNAVKDLIEHIGFGSKFWIGIKDNGERTQETKRLSFVDGDLNTKFFRVARGAFPWQPNNPDGERKPEDCVEWSPQDNDLFNDKECDAVRAFLCRNNKCTTRFPTTSPSESPTVFPTTSPSISPTVAPSTSPTLSPTLSPSFSPTASPVAQTDGSETLRMVFLGFSGASALGIAALLIIIQRERKQLQELKVSFALKFPPEPEPEWM